MNSTIKDLDKYNVFKYNMGTGPLLLRVAITNEPHLRLKDHPVSLVVVEGTKYIRVPLAYKGVFKYKFDKMGDPELLIFDDRFFESIIRNHENQVWDAAPYLRVGHNRNVSLGWFDSDSGGFLRVEGDVLVGYVKPTSDTAVQIVEQKQYRYSSVDVVLNWESTKLVDLEGDDVEDKRVNLSSQNLFDTDITLESMENFIMKRIKDKEGDANIDKDEEVILEASENVEHASVEVEEDIKEETVKLEGDKEVGLESDTEPEEKDTVILEEKDETSHLLESLREDKLRLERQLQEERTVFIMDALKAVGHNAAVLNTVNAILLEGKVERSNGRIITLEATESDVNAVGQFYQEGIAKLLLEVLLPQKEIVLEKTIKEKNPDIIDTAVKTTWSGSIQGV